jgi:SAM-dependent methyltransferase
MAARCPLAGTHCICCQHSSEIVPGKTVTGRIVRKKKWSDNFVLNLLPKDHTKTVSVRVDRETIQRGVTYANLFLRAVVRMTAQENDDAQCASLEDVELIECAADPHAVQAVLEEARRRLVVRREEEEEEEHDGPCCVLNWICRVLKLETIQRDHEAFGEEMSQQQIARLLVSTTDSTARHALVSSVVRGLQESDSNGRPERKRRPPHTKRRYLRVLEFAEQLVESRISTSAFRRTPGDSVLASHDQENSVGRKENRSENLDRRRQDASPTSILNLPGDTVAEQWTMRSNHHESLTRADYLLSKKHPQIQWMVDRMRQLADPARSLHVLDVGGGRGDLAVQVAVAFPAWHVTCIDTNESSLAAGRAYAEQVDDGLTARVRFVRADFCDVVLGKSDLVRPVDICCALHACGDLSDLALHFAASHAPCANFIICPCCYTKHYNSHLIRPAYWDCFDTMVRSHAGSTAAVSLDSTLGKNQGVVSSGEMVKVLGKLAEMNDRRDISKRATAVIDYVRLQCMKQQFQVSLEEYDASCSAKNVCLVGTKKGSLSDGDCSRT